MPFRPVSTNQPADSSTASPVDRSTTVFIADQSILVATLLQRRLNRVSSVRVVGRTSSAGDIVAQVAEFRPRIVLLSHDFSNTDSIKITKTIKKRVPGCRVIALFDRHRDVDIAENSEAGTDGYFLRDPASKFLETALAAVLNGETWFDPGLKRVMLHRVVEMR